MKDGSVLLDKLDVLNPELAQELRTVLGEDAVNTESAELLAESIPSHEFLAEMFNEDAEPISETVKDFSERYKFIDSPKFLNIPPQRNLAFEAIEKDGQQPMYVVWQIPEGYSRYLTQDSIARPDGKPKTENRNRWWPKEVIHSFAEQINERKPVGYMGHADFFTMSQLPDNVPVIWERAVRAIRKEDNKAVTLVRGYIYDFGMNRAYIKTQAINSASVFTVGRIEDDSTDKGTKDNPVLHVKEAQLISFDLVRKYNHGLPGTRLVADMEQPVADKATQSNVKESKSMLTPEQREAIANCTLEQLSELNPNLVAQLESVTHADNTLIETLRANLTKSVKECIGYERFAVAVKQMADHLNCETSEVNARVCEMFDSHRAGILEAIDLHCGNIKTQALRENVSKRLKELKFVKASDVKAAYDSEISAMHDLTKVLAEENKLGAVTGNEHETVNTETSVDRQWA